MLMRGLLLHLLLCLGGVLCTPLSVDKTGLYSAEFAASNDTSAPALQSDITDLQNKRCLSHPVTINGAYLNCPSEFVTNGEGSCEVTCSEGIPVKNTVSCTKASGWSTFPECNSCMLRGFVHGQPFRAPCDFSVQSCDEAVTKHFGVAGVYPVVLFGTKTNVYCDSEGFMLLGSVTAGESSDMRFSAKTEYRFGGAPVNYPVLPNSNVGIKTISDFPANTAMKMRCSENSGNTWTEYTFATGFSDYESGDKGTYGDATMWASLCNNGSAGTCRHYNYNCGDVVGASFYGIALCKGVSHDGAGSLVEFVATSSSATFIKCNMSNYSSSSGRFEILMKA